LKARIFAKFLAERSVNASSAVAWAAVDIFSERNVAAFGFSLIVALIIGVVL
jgi:hypothetical protein